MLDYSTFVSSTSQVSNTTHPTHDVHLLQESKEVKAKHISKTAMVARCFYHRTATCKDTGRFAVIALMHRFTRLFGASIWRPGAVMTACESGRIIDGTCWLFLYRSSALIDTLSYVETVERLYRHQNRFAITMLYPPGEEIGTETRWSILSFLHAAILTQVSDRPSRYSARHVVHVPSLPPLGLRRNAEPV